MKKIIVLDLDVGNVQSVSNSLNFINIKHKITSEKKDIKEATHIILPGVGSFGQLVKNLEHKIGKNFLIDHLKNKNNRILGICVGMQIMCELGLEFEKNIGMGLISGKCKKLNTKFKLPHIGWNNLIIRQKLQLLENINEKDFFYFVNSYSIHNNDKKVKKTFTKYDINFVSSLEYENIFGTQFHPEKSQGAGLRVLKNFIGI